MSSPAPVRQDHPTTGGPIRFLPWLRWPVTDAHRRRYGPVTAFVAAAAAALGIGSPYLPWAFSRKALDNMTFLGGPSPLQFLQLAIAVITLTCVLGGIARRRGWPALRNPTAGARGLARIGWSRAAKTAASGWLIFMLIGVAAIAVELGGLVNVRYGGWVATALAALAFFATRLLPTDPEPDLHRVELDSWVEIVIIVAIMGVGMFGATYALKIDDAGTFCVFLAFVVAVVLTLGRSGFGGFIRAAGRRHRRVLLLSMFVVAFAFPLTQSGSSATMSIATQVLVFAATALGLNIVVGLAGLLDLGYIAFLGAGSFTAAVLSRSAAATIDWHPPFLVVMIISGLVSATLGLIIGLPNLRVSGDYLAIVTLAFGEIFRYTMVNLDGSDGPNLIHGINGITAIPDLNLFGFDFGATRSLFGVSIPREANYYILLLVLIAIVMVIFRNINASRIGRGWVAIREDEKAAEAMGVNVFGLKVLAFAGGAFLAGIAGSVKAHVDVSITPDQFQFLDSAFLLAAVVLGGMGTIGGVLVGATLLKLAPEKLRFINDYRLLIFGLLLILMMRFRPEGLMPSARRQLEFHAEDEELAGTVVPIDALEATQVR
ncbi:MAG: branched-chain amino acid ABC transporter permease [Propionibacteriaceae bacterium]